MLETVSVFDAMELDNTQVRVASRRALALAHTRVESHLGRFLRAAQTEEEFFERLALVAEDFDGYVTTASQEVGHDKPEHIAAALKDHYRLAAQPPQFVKTPEEEEKEDEEEEEEGKVARLTKKDRKALKRLAKSDRTWSITAIHDKQSTLPVAGEESQPWESNQFNYGISNPLYDRATTDFTERGGGDPAKAAQYYNHYRQQHDGMESGAIPSTLEWRQWRDDPASVAQFGQRPSAPSQGSGQPGVLSSVEGKQGSPLAGQAPEPDPLDEHWDIDRPAFFDQQGLLATDPLRDQQGYIGPNAPKDIAHDEGYEQIPYQVNPEDPRTQRDYGNDQGLEIAPNLPSVSPPRGAPIHQGSNEHEQVTCPECGGDGKQAGVNRCGKCKGAGKVPNFGDSMVDAVGADIKTSENHNNTDLGGPEPKMDKAKWTPSNPGEPKVEDGLWPTKRKDVTEPIKATNESPLTEIGEKSTETKDLPANSGDAGFSGDGPGPAPHTDTFGNDGQTDPVTREALANTTHTNPLSEMLLADFPPDTVVQAAFLEEALT